LDLSFILLSIVIYGVLFFSMGAAFLPGHAAWCTLLLWASALIGALIANQIFLPRVIGMLVAGILLQNIPWSAIDAFPKKWGTQMRAAALATIFLRCGLELDFGTMKKYKFPAICLALIPGIIEALYDAGLGVALFSMDYTLGLCMGFILKAVGPGLVVPAMFRLQKNQMGTDQGIPSTVVIAASFDDIVAITGYAIFSTIAIQPAPGSDAEENIAWSIASGPLQVVFGLVGGLLAGYAVGATRLWDTHVKRFFALFGAGLLLMFFLEYWGMLSGGALGALFTGLVASNLWERGSPERLSLGPSLQFSPDCERWMSVVWRWVMEPMLFVTVGSTLDFETLSGGTIPKALIIVFTGVILRMITTYISMSGFEYSWKEKVFYGLAWTPKATVQAALSAAPLTLIKEYKVGAPDYDEWVKWGNDILTTGLFAIIICGTLGVLAIHFTAPVLLKPAAAVDHDGNDEDESTSTEEEERESGGGGGGTENQGHNATTTTTIPANGITTINGAQKSPLESTSASGLAATAAIATTIPTSTFDRVPSGQRMRRVGSEVQVRPNSPTFEGLIAGEDFSLVADYIDSIQHLTTAVNAGEQTYSREDVLRLSQRVLDMQQRIESGIGHREPSVRELFRTASVLRSRRSTSAASSSFSNFGIFGSGLGSTRSGAGSRSIGNMDRSQGRSLNASHSRARSGDDIV
jgi:NhaP-type Na+/H+ or K+/H+ antiporter